MSTDVAKAFHEGTYGKLGLAAQRYYPNEELLRFMGSWYFPVPREERGNIKVLEVGCGSGANLWMIAKEGFDAYGIDLSETGLALCRQMLQHWGVQATLAQGSMTKLPYPDRTFDALVDVFSGNCMAETEFGLLLDEAARVLKPGGRFFSYTPSKNNDSFRDPGASTFLDASTLDGIRRPSSPFAGQMYPFQFTEPAEFRACLEERGFKVLRNERIGRTYRDQEEYFEFTSIHAERL